MTRCCSISSCHRPGLFPILPKLRSEVMWSWLGGTQFWPVQGHQETNNSRITCEPRLLLTLHCSLLSYIRGQGACGAQELTYGLSEPEALSPLAQLDSSIRARTQQANPCDSRRPLSASSQVAPGKHGSHQASGVPAKNVKTDTYDCTRWWPPQRPAARGSTKGQRFFPCWKKEPLKG